MARQSEELLLRGPALAEAEGWLIRQGNGLTEEQQRFTLREHPRAAPTRGGSPLAAAPRVGT